MAVVRRGKKKGEAIYLGPDLPAGGAYLWAAYSDLDDARDPGFGFAPLQESEIFFYAANRNFSWTLHELNAIRAIDKAHRIFVAETQKTEAEAP